MHRAPPGPLVITAYSAEVSDIQQWASASKLSQPATCVDLSGRLDADKQVLITYYPRRPGVSSCHLKLHFLSDKAPKLSTLQSKDGLDDKPFEKPPGDAGPTIKRASFVSLPSPAGFDRIRIVHLPCCQGYPVLCIRGVRG